MNERVSESPYQTRLLVSLHWRALYACGYASAGRPRKRGLRRMIFHIAARAEWEVAVRDGIYTPPSIAAEGFIHCSTREQIIATANLFYRGRPDLVLLTINESLVAVPLRYEAPVAADDVRAAINFPHIYGPLNLDAVIRTEAFPC